jgi:serine/threonine protein kinase
MSFLDMSCRNRVALAAQATQDDLSSQSRITRDLPTVQQISWSDVHEQTLIGIGGFSRVNQVKIDTPSFEGQRFAMKSLKRNIMDNEMFFLEAGKDLSAEAVILSRVQHRNIIKLHAVCEGGPFKAFTETKRGYFLVLDLLDDSLANKLEMSRKDRGRMPSSIRSSKGNSTPEVFDRLKNIAIDLARGLGCLHQNNVVLRDLKPDNIGFDHEGTVKIFDLGFAREIHTMEETEICGTVRYMAPEVMRGERFTTASDVYSFGVVLWELCTLEKPYDRFKTAKCFIDHVAHKNWRPSLSSIESVSLRRLIEDCWHPDPARRPSMARVAKILSLQVGRYSGFISPVQRQFSNRMITRSQPFSGPIDFHPGSEVSLITNARPSRCSTKPSLHAKFATAISHYKPFQHTRRPTFLHVGRKKATVACQA